MKLFEISYYINDILLNEEIDQNKKLELLENLNISLGEKIGNLLAHQQQEEIELLAKKEYIKAKLKEIDIAVNANQALKEYALQTMLKHNLNEIKCKHFVSVKLVKNGGLKPLHIKESLNIDDVPESFLVVKKELNKKEIRESLEAGEVLDWASIGDAGFRLNIKG